MIEANLKQYSHDFSYHAEEVSALDISSDFQILVTASENGFIRIYALLSKEIVTEFFSTHEGSVDAVSISPCSKFIASGGYDSDIKIWHMKNVQHLATLTGHEKAIKYLKFTDDSTLLLSGSADYTCRIWDLNADIQLQHILRHDGFVSSIDCFSEITSSHALKHNILMLVATASWDSTVKVWCFGGTQKKQSNIADSPSKDDKSPVLPMTAITDHSRPVVTVCFSKQGMLATGSQDKTVKLWKVSFSEDRYSKLIVSATILHTFSGHLSWISCLCFSPCQTYLCSAADDQSARMWDIIDGRCINVLQVDIKGQIMFSAFKANEKGTSLVIGGSGGLKEVFPGTE